MSENNEFVTTVWMKSKQGENEFSVPIYESKNFKASFDTIFSVGIISHGISFNF